MVGQYRPSFEEVYDFAKLYEAHTLARRGKQMRREIVEFELDLAANLVELSDALRSGTYKPLPYRRFTVNDPKRRSIHSLRYCDRVVQHSLCDNVLAPVIEPRLVFDNAACRKGKGTHFALGRLSRFMREHYRLYGPKGWFLKCDVHHYFSSIDHAVLWDKLARLPFDEETCLLIGTFLDSFDEQGEKDGERPRGLPLGSQSSQWFALYFLDTLDRLVKERLGIRAYTRYMDDIILIHHDREYLQGCLARMREHLSTDLLLEFNHKTQISPLAQGIDYLGFHLYLTPTGKVVRRLRQSAKRRIKRKVRSVGVLEAHGVLSHDKVREIYKSYWAHLSHGHARGFIKSIDWSLA